MVGTLSLFSGGHAVIQDLTVPNLEAVISIAHKYANINAYLSVEYACFEEKIVIGDEYHIVEYDITKKLYERAAQELVS